MNDAVATAVAAQSLRVVKTEGGESWGRVAAVDGRGLSYVLSWEPFTEPSGNSSLPCVLLFVSCDPGDGAVSLGQLAQAVRAAAERSG